MPTRDVKPFDNKQWSKILEDQRNGPTDEQLEKIAKVKERIANMPQISFLE